MNNPYQHLKKYEGKEFKYKEELCPLLNIEYKVGKAKDLQLNQLRQYMDIEKVNRKIKINKIYEDDEIEIIENRGKYLTHIENFLIILLSKCAMQNYNYVVLTNRDILELTMMVNQNYFKGLWNIYKYIDDFHLDINKDDLDMLGEYYEETTIINQSNLFFSASYRLFKRIIYDCLVSMEKRNLILKNKTYVCYKNYKEGKAWKSEVFECDDDMIQRILTVQYNAVKEFNELMKEDEFTKKFYLRNADSTYVLPPLQKAEFKRILNYYFKEEFKEEGFSAFSRAWKLNLGNSVVFENELKTRSFNGKKLNQNIINKLMNAKDLRAVTEILRKQFITKFITKFTLSKESETPILISDIRAKPYKNKE